jgi:hypothetical protein
MPAIAGSQADLRALPGLPRIGPAIAPSSSGDPGPAARARRAGAGGAAIDEDTGAPWVHEQPLDNDTARRLNHTIKVLREDLQDLRFNTAIARLTELNTHAAKLATAVGMIRRDWPSR